MGDHHVLNSDDTAMLKTRLKMESRVNPFEVKAPWTVWEVMKAVLGIVLVPLRLILAVLCMVVIAICGEIAVLGGIDNTKPMGWGRRLFVRPMSFLCRLMLFIFGYYWIPTKGKIAKRKDAPVIVVGPHSTFMDSFVCGSYFGINTGLAKESVIHTPLFASVAKASQMILVKREAADGRKQALEEFTRRARSTEKWRYLLVFPEGTCTNRKALIQFKKGAFVPGVPIQPVLIRWPHWFFDPSWTAASSRLALGLRLLTQIFNRCEVEFLPIYTPNEEEKENPELFAENVRQLMASKLGVPTTEHSYEDSFLSAAARKGKFDLKANLDFEFVQAKLVNIDLKEAKRLLRVFGKDSKVRKTGKMSVVQFANALKLPLSRPLQDIFELLDTDEDGKIDYKSFLIGLSFVSSKISTEDSISILFEALDPEGTGKISRESLKAVLNTVFKNPDKKLSDTLFSAADPDNTGSVDKENFTAFVKKRPELLVFGIAFTNTYKADHQPIQVLSPKQVSKGGAMVAKA